MDNKKLTALMLVIFGMILTSRPTRAEGQSSLVVSPPVLSGDQLAYHIQRTEDGITSLVISGILTGTSRTLTVPAEPGGFLPALRLDRLGRPWLAWAQGDGGDCLLLVARVSGDSLLTVERFPLSAPLSSPPDFCFDSSGRPWFVFVTETHDGFSLYTLEAETPRPWRVSGPVRDSLCSPRITFAPDGKAWVFWTGIAGGAEEIFYRTFDGTSWSQTLPLTPADGFPSITPRIHSDHSGRIWIVWSDYDGEDYEIRCRSWNGAYWSSPVGLSDNTGRQDVAPAVHIALGRIPVVSWTQITDRDSRLCIRLLHENGWSRTWIPGIPGESIPAIAGEAAVLIRTKDDASRIEVLPLGALASTAEDPGEERRDRSTASPGWPAWPRPPSPQIIYNPDLSESKYIGFGDSITFGTLDHEDAPEKGYIPRLETLLTQSFGPTTVINSGLGGETTQAGLQRIPSVLRAYKARYILILEGTNDTIWQDFSLETSAFNLREMARLCLEYGLLPSLSTLLPRFDSSAKPARINNLNQHIRQICTDLAVPLVDLYEEFDNYPEELGGVYSLLSEDVKHPSEKGYQLMAEEWHESIRKYPFPPGNMQIKREYDKILFFQKAGNMITWDENPKIQDAALIQGYRIYRKKETLPGTPFEFLAFVSTRKEYYDTDINGIETFVYVISALRTDGVEGPCSQSVKR